MCLFTFHYSLLIICLLVLIIHILKLARDCKNSNLSGIFRTCRSRNEKEKVRNVLSEEKVRNVHTEEKAKNVHSEKKVKNVHSEKKVKNVLSQKKVRNVLSRGEG